MKPSEIELIARILEDRPPAGVTAAARRHLVAAFRAAFGPKPEGTRIEFSTILSDRDGEGKVEMMVNSEVVQFDLAKARHVRSMLDGAIEAAVSDGLLYRFLVDKVGMSTEVAGRALLDFREMRQGSRDTVYPQ
jgi:hypothetical protein